MGHVIRGTPDLGLQVTAQVKCIISNLNLGFFDVLLFLPLSLLLTPRNLIWTCYMTRTLHGLSHSTSSVLTTQQWLWFCTGDPYFHTIAFTNQSSLLPLLWSLPSLHAVFFPFFSFILSQLFNKHLIWTVIWQGHHSCLNHSHPNQCGHVSEKQACNKMNEWIISLGPNIKNKDLMETPESGATNSGLKSQGKVPREIVSYNLEESQKDFLRSRGEDRNICVFPL